MSSERPTNPEALRPSGTVPAVSIPRSPTVPDFSGEYLQSLIDAAAERAAKRAADHFIESTKYHHQKVEAHLVEHRREALARLRADEQRERRFDIFCAEVRSELLAIKHRLDEGNQRFERNELEAFVDREKGRRVLETVSALKLLANRRPLGAEGPLAGAAVLVVEDDADVQFAVVRTLEDAGAAAYYADGLDGARQIVELQHPQVVVVDVALKGGDDGMRLVREICLGHGEVGVVVASGHVDAALREEARELGVVACLQKPYSAEALVSAVVEARDSARGTAA